MTVAAMLLVAGGCSGGDDPDLTPPQAPVTEPVPAPTGIPGLDSDDVFCAAWSRYAGSFQVIAVASSFAAPDEALALEVAGSGTVTSAFTDLRDNWPADLAAEQDLVLGDVLGPFAGRVRAAAAALTHAGADADAVVAIDAAWLAALARRDPESPVLTLDLDPGVQALIDAAAGAYGAEALAVVADPALVSSAATPLTDAYLAANCPDEGLLAGAEVDS